MRKLKQSFSNHIKSYVFWGTIALVMLVCGLLAVYGQSNELIEAVPDFDPTQFPDSGPIPWAFIVSAALVPTIVRLIRYNVLAKLPSKYLVWVAPILGVLGEIITALMGAPQGGQVAAGGLAGIGTHQIAKKMTQKTPDSDTSPSG